MRITMRISGAGEYGLAVFPYIDIESIEKDLCTNGSLDEAKCRRAFCRDNIIQMSSDDCLPVFFFAAHLLKNAGDACRESVVSDDPDSAVWTKARTPDDMHAQRNMKKGRIVYMRMDISYAQSRNAVRMRINVDNPVGVAGVAEKVARDYALVFARMALVVSKKLVEVGYGYAYEFSGGPGYAEVFDDARESWERYDAEKAMREDEERRLACPHLHGGMCTADEHGNPPVFSCAHYVNGNCVKQKTEKKT